MFWSRCVWDRLDFSLRQSGSLLWEHFNFGPLVYLLSDQGENSIAMRMAPLSTHFLYFVPHVCSYNFSKVFRHKLILQALVVQTLDSAIHWINHYPADKY